MTNNRQLKNDITRIVCSASGTALPPSSIIEQAFSADTILVTDRQQPVDFSSSNKKLFTQLEFDLKPREIRRLDTVDSQSAYRVVKTVDGERAMTDQTKLIKISDAYEGRLTLGIADDECIYGLGQHENGIYNYRGVKEYLYQNNMKIPMPVLLSSRGYALVFDAGCLMTYEEKDNKIDMVFDAVDQIAYYIIAADTFDELVKGVRTLTGQPAMLPRWAYGYIQSKERYVSAEDVLTTAAEFKRRGIPLSCIVLDWKSWEEGKWGNKIIDKERFPDFKGMVDTLHENGIAFMLSVWPNINRKGEDHAEMMAHGKLLADMSTYDAFDEEARSIYWQQLMREIIPAGTDALWCDSTEPFTPDWSGVEKKSDEERYLLSRDALTKHLDARQANLYAVMHAKGIYERYAKLPGSKRFVNLTRSGYLSGQKYATILWSGDIYADWHVMKSQIAEGLSISMSCVPYWTLDIGAFFVGNDAAYRRWLNDPVAKAPWFWQGRFEQGKDDLGYRELYARWLQLGTFLPIMRSHGTDTPREPWQFGEEGSLIYDTIVHHIKLRYRMLPYTYSLAWGIVQRGETIMRSLMFDFASDKRVHTIADQYMFGPALLVCPVVHAMRYGPDSQPLNLPEVRNVYLPEGSDWYDMHTGQLYPGGSDIEAYAPINRIPVYARSGAILPEASDGNAAGIPDIIHVYEGSDGAFTLYMDNGSDMAYLEGAYAEIRLAYSDATRTLVIGDAQGNWPCSMKKPDCVLHTRNGTQIRKSTAYSGAAVTVAF